MYILYTDSVLNKDVEAQTSISLSPCSSNRERGGVVSLPTTPLPPSFWLPPSLGRMNMGGGVCGGVRLPRVQPRSAAAVVPLPPKPEPGWEPARVPPARSQRGRTPCAQPLTRKRGRNRRSQGTLLIPLPRQLGCPFLSAWRCSSQWKDDGKTTTAYLGEEGAGGKQPGGFV